MNRVFKLRAAMAALCLVLTGCGVVAPGPASPVAASATAPEVGATAENTLVITTDMKDKSVSLSVGDTFEIRIPTIPRAGFDWVAQDLDASMLVQLGAPVFQADSVTGAGGGLVTLKFRVVAAGTTTLNLLYANAAESGAAALYSDSFGITVTAK